MPILGQSTQSLLDEVKAFVRRENLPLGEAASKVEAFAERMDAVETTAADVDARVERVDPGTSGATGQLLTVGPSGPAWMNDPVFNVRHPRFGAKGDGVVDDWAAIQGALDNLPSSNPAARGGKVVLEPGHVYGISQTLTITLPNTDLDGLVGGTLTTLGACTIKALPGFIGPLIRVNIPSGSKGAWIRNLRLDGNGEAGVTAGIEYAEGTISVAHVFDVAITNTGTGIKTNRNCQSVIWERVIAVFGLTQGLNIGADNRHMIARDCRFGGTQWGAVVGPDNNLSADAVETMIFEGCEIYGVGPSASGVVLIRNAENPRLTNCYIEMSGTNSAVVEALVLIGTNNAIVRAPVLTGNRFGGNSKAQYAVRILNCYYPFVAFNGTDTSMTVGQVKDDNLQTAFIGSGFVQGGLGNQLDQLYSVIGSRLPSGFDALQAYVANDAFPRVAIRASTGGLLFGGGGAAADILLYRHLANILTMGVGDHFRLDGTWNGGHLHMGNYRLWVDATGKLRVKNGAPTSDTDGTVVGSQV